MKNETHVKIISHFFVLSPDKNNKTTEWVKCPLFSILFSVVLVFVSLKQLMTWKKLHKYKQKMGNALFFFVSRSVSSLSFAFTWSTQSTVMKYFLVPRDTVLFPAMNFFSSTATLTVIASVSVSPTTHSTFTVVSHAHLSDGTCSSLLSTTTNTGHKISHSHIHCVVSFFFSFTVPSCRGEGRKQDDKSLQLLFSGSRERE